MNRGFPGQAWSGCPARAMAETTDWRPAAARVRLVGEGSGRELSRRCGAKGAPAVPGSRTDRTTRRTAQRAASSIRARVPRSLTRCDSASEPVTADVQRISASPPRARPRSISGAARSAWTIFSRGSAPPEEPLRHARRHCGRGCRVAVRAVCPPTKPLLPTMSNLAAAVTRPPRNVCTLQISDR